MTTLRTAAITSLAAMAALLAGCGPSAEERAAREQAIAARAMAEAAKAKGPQLASAEPAPAPSPEPVDDVDALEAENEDGESADGPIDPTPQDNTGDDGSDDQQLAMPVPPEIPFAQPPAMIDVPRPDPEPFEPAERPPVEYVRVRS